MRTTTTNNDVYLSILASRAVTGLARLAEHPDRWNAGIESDLAKGVAFCDSLAEQPNVPATAGPEPIAKILRRLTTEISTRRPHVHVPQDEVLAKKQFLQQLLSRERLPTVPEIADAINFFFTATSGYTVRQRQEEELFES